jgi:hypothetical protein
LGGYVLSLNDEIFNHELDDGDLSILEIIKNTTSEYLGIDRNWPIYYKNIGILETEKQFNDDSMCGAHFEKVIHIIYATYFQNVPKANNGAKWIDITKMSELDEVSQNIIRLSAIQRG